MAKAQKAETRARVALERAGPDGGHYFLRIVPPGELEVTMNLAHTLGYRDLQWDILFEGEGYTGGPQLWVQGERPDPDECPACGRSLVDEDDCGDDATAEA
jgi:hypothetical protein